MSGGRIVQDADQHGCEDLTDEGIDGWAETCPLGATYLPAHARGVIPALHELARRGSGADPTNLPTSIDECAKALMGHHYAKSPLDVAVAGEIYGKAVGRPR